MLAIGPKTIVNHDEFYTLHGVDIQSEYTAAPNTGASNIQNSAPLPSQTLDNASTQMPIRKHANSVPNQYWRLANSYLRIMVLCGPLCV